MNSGESQEDPRAVNPAIAELGTQAITVPVSNPSGAVGNSDASAMPTNPSDIVGIADGQFPFTLCDLISGVESAGRYDAIRFEPTVYSGRALSNDVQKIVSLIAMIHRCSTSTARVIFSTSFGKFQIMGYNIYSLCGYTKTIFTFVDSPSGQYTALDTYLSKRGINYTMAELKNPVTRAQFARDYNGPANVSEYVERMETVMRKWGAL